MIKAIIFDYDETLVKTMDSRIPAYIDLANKYGIKLTPKQIRSALGKPYEEFIKTLYGDVDTVESIVSKYQVMIKNYPMLPYEGAIETVKLLSNRYKVGILSGVKRKLMLEDLKKLKFPIEKFFYVQCGDDTVVHKPDPRAFEPIIKELRKLDVKPNEALYVGDDLRDFEASTKAGMQSVGICGHTTSDKEFEKAGADYVYRFEELVKKYG